MGQPLSKTCWAPVRGQRAVAKHIIASWSPRSEVVYAFSAHISMAKTFTTKLKVLSISGRYQSHKANLDISGTGRENTFLGKRYSLPYLLTEDFFLPSNNLSSKQIVVILLKHTSFKNFEPYCLLLVFSLLVVS